MEITEFERFLRDAEKSEATVRKYVRDVEKFCVFLGGLTVNRELVLKYKEKLSQEYATVSANGALAALNMFFRFLGREDLRVKQLKVQKALFCSEEKELTRDEYSRLVDAARKKGNERLDAILQTICSTGIRVSELKFITVESIRTGVAVVTNKGKTRTVLLPGKLQKKLNAYIKCRKILSGSVFVTKGGKPMDRSNIWREMKALCKSAGVAASKVFPHNLRHLFARCFYSIDKDIAKLADILGHSSINTTRIYIVSTGAEHRRKLEQLRLVI